MAVGSPEPLRLLVLHPTAAFGGSSKSLIELLGGRGERVTVTVLCPPGASADRFRAAGFDVEEVYGMPCWDDTRYGHYRGWRWLILLRELARALPAWSALRRMRSRGFDVVHANDVIVLPTAWLARRVLRCPLVVHVRALMRGAGGDRRTRWVEGWLARQAAAVVAIDGAVRRTLPAELTVEVIHNALRVDGAPAVARRVPGARLRIATIGVLHRSKGVYEFIEALGICRDRGLDVEAWIVGANVRELRGPVGWLLARMDLARDVRGELEARVAELGLGDRVMFKGFVGDVRTVLPQIDILCFASLLDAPGRSVFEAAHYGVPSIVAVREPTPDTIVHGETGLCIETPSPQAQADAIERLCRDRTLLRRLGDGAAALAARNFDADRNAEQLVSLLERVARGREPACAS